MVIYFKNYLLNHIRTDNTLLGVCGLEKNVCRPTPLRFVAFRVAFTSSVLSYIMWYTAWNTLNRYQILIPKNILNNPFKIKCICLVKVLCAFVTNSAVLNQNDIASAWASIEFKWMIIYRPCFGHRYVASARIVSGRAIGPFSAVSGYLFCSYVYPTNLYAWRALRLTTLQQNA